MIATIVIYVFMLSLLYLLPLSELFPTRHLQKTVNVILSRTKVEQGIMTPSVNYIKRLFPLLALINKLLRIDGFAPRWYKYKDQLRVANVERIVTVEQFVGVKFLITILLISYCALIFVISQSIEMIILSVILGWIGFYLPDRWIKLRIKQRRWKIQREIPSILVSLAVTTDAGLSLMQALEEVCNRKPGELSSEIKMTLQEIAVGVPQKEALESMVNRVLVEELTIMVSALLQTMEKGASGLTRVLRDQANEAWVKRKSKAKETGEKASIKLFLPLMGFILPALMIFLIAPAIFTIIQFFEF